MPATKTDLRYYAQRIDFRGVGQHTLLALREMDANFRETFRRVTDAELMRAIEADLPKLVEINRTWWPSHHKSAA